MKKITIFLVFCTIITLPFWLIYDQSNINGRLPVPTEFNEKKLKRKDFKNQRKEYFKQMHRSNPENDWKKMDEMTRKKRTDKINQLRQNNLTKLGSLKKTSEIISNDLIGTWEELGSNNLAGRILTADIDWVNNLIYCASDGGNIWRGD